MKLTTSTQDILDYFEFNGIDTTNHHCTYMVAEIANKFNLTQEQIAVLMCNLEDEETMKELVNGDFDVFDPWDESQFNDGYWDVMEQLGLSDDN